MPNGNARLTTHARALLVARQAHPYRCEETQPHPPTAAVGESTTDPRPEDPIGFDHVHAAVDDHTRLAYMAH